MRDIQTPVTFRTRSLRRILLVVYAIVLTVVSHASYADSVKVPPVPSGIQAPEGNKAYFAAHAIGTQNYICLPSGWAFFGPQATLYMDNDKQVTTHFLSPNPLENGTLRATWQHSKDTSSVWALAINSSIDPDYVEPNTIPWLLLRVVGAHDGTAGMGRLSQTTYIQRLNTTGGSMPSTGCTVPTDIGKKAFVPYEADYFFYRDANNGQQ